MSQDGSAVSQIPRWGRNGTEPMTKDEAREESLRRWQALAAEERETLEHAQIFAAALAGQLDFRTMGNARKVILGWLVNTQRGRPAWGFIVPEGISDSSPGEPEETAAA